MIKSNELVSYLISSDPHCPVTFFSLFQSKKKMNQQQL